MMNRIDELGGGGKPPPPLSDTALRARQQELNQPPASITVPPPAQQTLDVPPGTPIDQIAESGPTFRVDLCQHTPANPLMVLVSLVPAVSLYVKETQPPAFSCC